MIYPDTLHSIVSGPNNCVDAVVAEQEEARSETSKSGWEQAIIVPWFAGRQESVPKSGCATTAHSSSSSDGQTRAIEPTRRRGRPHKLRDWKKKVN